MEIPITGCVAQISLLNTDFIVDFGLLSSITNGQRILARTLCPKRTKGILLLDNLLLHSVWLGCIRWIDYVSYVML